MPELEDIPSGNLDALNGQANDQGMHANTREGRTDVGEKHSNDQEVHADTRENRADAREKHDDGQSVHVETPQRHARVQEEKSLPSNLDSVAKRTHSPADQDEDPIIEYIAVRKRRKMLEAKNQEIEDRIREEKTKQVCSLIETGIARHSLADVNKENLVAQLAAKRAKAAALKVVEEQRAKEAEEALEKAEVVVQ